MRNSNTKELVLTALFAAIIVIMAFTPLGYIPLFIINATIIHIPVILGSLFCGPKKGAVLGFIFGFTSFINNTFRSTSLSAFVFSPVLASSVIGTEGIFKSLFICFVPRILVGVLPYFIYCLVKKALSSKQKNISATILNVFVALFLFIGIRAFLLKVLEENGDANVIMIISIVVALLVFAFVEWFTMKKNGNIVSFVYAAVGGAMVNTLLVMGSIFVLYKDAYAKALDIDPTAVLGVIGGVISFNGVIEAIVAAIIVSAIGVILNRIKPIETQK